MLGVSPYRIRVLCRAGAIEAELRENNHWYISQTVVDDLRAKGELPPLPALPEFFDGEQFSEDEEGTASPGESTRRPVRGRHEELYSEPSPELAKSKEELIKLGHSAEAQRLKRDIRKADQAEREERSRAREAAQARQWRDKYRRWVIEGVPGELCAAALAELERLLDKVSPGENVERPVMDLIEAVLRPVRERRQRERQQAARVQWIEKVLSSLRLFPLYDALTLHETREDREDSLDLARAALKRLPEDATEREMTGTAEQAMEPVRERIRSKKAAQEYQSRVQRALGSVDVRGGNWSELQEARELAADALAKMPVGSSERELRDKVADAIQRIVERCARRRAEEERESQEAERQRQAEHRKWQLDYAFFGYSGRLARHIAKRVDELEGKRIFFDDNYWRRNQERDGLLGALREEIEPLLRVELERNPKLSDAELEVRARSLVNQHYEKFLDDGDEEDDDEDQAE